MYHVDPTNLQSCRAPRRLNRSEFCTLLRSLFATSYLKPSANPITRFGQPYNFLLLFVLFQTLAPQLHPILLAGTDIQAERFGFVCPVLDADTLGATASFRHQLPPSPAPCWTGPAKR